MSRRGKNIFKRKDGRWEGRYISSYMENGRAKYSSVYAYSYVECSQKLQLAKVDLLPKNDPITVSELFLQAVKIVLNHQPMSVIAPCIRITSLHRLEICVLTE